MMDLQRLFAAIPFFSRLSLRTKLVFSFLLVVLVGGILSSLIGAKLVADTLIHQAHTKVQYDLRTAWLVYHENLNRLRQVVQLTASGRTIPERLESDRLEDLGRFLARRRQDFGLDLLTLTDAAGRVILRTRHPFLAGDDRSADLLIGRALKGETTAATIVLPEEALRREGGDLAERARIKLVPTPQASEAGGEETSGLMLLAASPVLNETGRLMGVLYGGLLLNRNYEIVDQVRDLLYGQGRYQGKEMGTATIFQNGHRISTNVRDERGERAIGTRVSKEVYEAVVNEGRLWVDRAFVVKDWYITAYEPIRDPAGRIVGILYVGMLEAPYLDLRNKVVLSFFGIGVLGVLLVLLLAFFITTGIIRPLRQMVWATKRIAEGDLEVELSVPSGDEIGQLAGSFNHMLVRLKQARRELEEWGRTLEEKVEQRTRQLQRIQGRLMQSEKLASLGRLASGVAHEINNPLTGILTFSHLLLRRFKDRPEVQKELELIVRETTRVSTIVRGLLDFARESRPQKKPCLVNELLRQTLALVESQAAFHNIRIERRLAPDLPPALLDANQMQQVFMNILLNAADAMPVGGALTVSTTPDEVGLRICLSDTGCGIAEKDLPRIFDPFFTLGAEAGGIVEIPSAYQPLAFRRMSRALKAARARRLLGRHILGTSYSFDLEIRETEGQGLRTPESASLICSACARSIFDLEGPGKDEVSKRPEWPAPFYMNNVETYLNIPLILVKGAAWFSQVGDRNAPGTKIFALTGKTSHPCLIEAPIGSTLNDLLGMADGDNPGLTGELKAFQMGGPAGGIFPSSFRTTPMDFDSLAHIGWKMGSGYIVLLDEKICTVEMARYSLGQVIGQACERCHPCLQALRNILAILSRLCQGLGEDGDLETLEVLAGHIRSRGRCNLALAGALPVETSLRYFRDEYEAHLKRRCPARFCRDLAQADPAFRLAA